MERQLEECFSVFFFFLHNSTFTNQSGRNVLKTKQKNKQKNKMSDTLLVQPETPEFPNELQKVSSASSQILAFPSIEF